MDLLLPIAILPGVAALGARALNMTGPTALTLAARASWTSFGLVAAAAMATVAGISAFDALSLALALLTAFVGSIVLSFSRRHMKADPRLATYALRIGLLISSVLVFVSAHDLLSFAVAWVASGWLLSALIGHVPGWVEAEAAEKRARMAFLIGDTSLVAALAALALWGRTLDMSTAIAAAADMPVIWIAAVAALLLIAAIARSAVPPFHKWLMGSMTAPTPVSALMHAGLVNAGGFLLIRFAPVLEASPTVQLAAILIGAAGALFGTGVMLVRPDVKRALGGSTVAQMSFMIMTCGLGAYAAALWHLIAHGLFKAWLFLGAGSNVGRAQPKTLAPMSPIDTLAILGAGAVLAWVVIGRGLTDALPLPVLFAGIAGLTSVASLVRAPSRSAASLALVAVSLGLGLAYVGGIALIESLAGLPRTASLLAMPAQLALLAPFVVAWIWQVAKLPLPTALYIRMLNTGGPALIR